ncbi:PKD domain-containing protein [Kitasatospora sp. NPDC002227]|uniref:PKD domain-containing protein n=1 Tax=Kitasatospora sp. NPDC002227 TaxID=3154773 RepID=UPI00332EE6F5
MSHSRRRRQLAAALVVASTGLVSAGVTLPAVAADAVTLYVDDSAANCADGGTGSQEQPFCTIQAGVDAAKPGQTVQVEYGKGHYAEQVTVHHSGEPGKPIVVTGRQVGRHQPTVGVFGSEASPENARGFLLDHVHDVTVHGFMVQGVAAEGILVKDSSAVTVDGTWTNDVGLGAWAPGTSTRSVEPGAPALRVTGASSGVTFSRNRVSNAQGDGIAVEAGVTGAVVTTNGLLAEQPRGIRVTDAPGTVVTSNTVAGFGAEITLAGKSDHATVENNVLTRRNPTVQTKPELAELSVSADSAAGTKADYNSVDPGAGNAAYSWAGTDYQQLTDYAKATGQGAHDLQEAPVLGVVPPNGALTPTAATGQTDSADATAPGELATDLYGQPRVDDPQAVNSGTGAGYYDRGAVEFQAFASLWVSTDATKGPYPLPVTVTATAKQNWPDTTSYTYDFGDGSDPLTTADAKVQHVYQAKGSYTVKVTATGTGENMSATATSQPFTVTEPGDLTPALAVTPEANHGPLGFGFDLSHSTSPWIITGYQLDYGDGSPKETGDSYHPTFEHTYLRPGDYTVTATLTDGGGRTAKLQQVVHATYGKLGFTPITPTRVLDTRLATGPYPPHRLGPGESTTISLPAQPGQPPVSPAALVLNVTAVNPSQAGYLSVYPSGTDRPATSNVNFKAGQTVPNLVTVPTGEGGQVTLYNFSGTTDVVVDVMGFYQSGGGSRFDAVAPSRLLDTRKSAAVGPDASTSIQVRGAAGVPADATAVVLNLTSTASDVGGYLTAYASGTARPGTSNLNFAAGQTVANQVVVPIGADGKVSVYNKFGHTHVVADVFGYYGPSGALFTPVVPTRLVDTRKQTALGAGKSLKVATGVPAGATAAVLNVTSTASTAGGYLTVWADGATKPGTSNVNFPAGATVPNHVTTPLGTNGAFDVYNFAGSTQVVADLFGYFSEQ